jgi:hypothetical protein
MFTNYLPLNATGHSYAEFSFQILVPQHIIIYKIWNTIDKT